MNEEIERMQTHLALIRYCAGWSAAVLGEKLGVSRQMVSSLESGRAKMTRMQYLAIRQVFSEEISTSPQDDVRMLKDVIDVLVEHPENYTIEERNQVLRDANLLAPSIVAKKSTRSTASAAWVATLAGAALAAAALGIKALTDSQKKG